MQAEKKFLTTTEVGKALGLSIGTVKSLVAKGFLEAVRTSGGHMRIYADSVEKYADGFAHRDATLRQWIYVISPVSEAEQEFESHLMHVKFVSHPLEILVDPTSLDSLFIDSACTWLESAPVAMLSNLATRCNLSIYNGDGLPGDSPLRQLGAIKFLRHSVNRVWIEAYLQGRFERKLA
jgi:excisionase family DNA binding protein